MAQPTNLQSLIIGKIGTASPVVKGLTSKIGEDWGQVISDGRTLIPSQPPTEEALKADSELQARLKAENQTIPDDWGGVGGKLPEGEKLKLPARIATLIDNPCYQNRVLFIARNWGIGTVEKMAELARKKAKPSRYFAKIYSKANFLTRTLPIVQRLIDQAEKIKAKLKALGGNLQFLPYYYKVLKKVGWDKLQRIFQQAEASKNPTVALKTLAKESLTGIA